MIIIINFLVFNLFIVAGILDSSMHETYGINCINYPNSVCARTRYAHKISPNRVTCQIRP